MKSLKTIGLTTLIVVLISFSSAMAQKIDLAASSVKWTGYHLAKSYEHVGEVKIKSGEVSMEDGMLTGGQVIIDMSSISNDDLEGGKNVKLVNHLKSDDFFNVEKYPEAKLTITSVEKAGTGYSATGDIEIRGIKESVTFTLAQTGMELTGKISVDRTKHEVMYGWSLENAMLSNNFDLDVKIVVSGTAGL